MKIPHKVSLSEMQEACTEFMDPKGFRVTLALNSNADTPRKEILVSSKFSGFQDNQIVGDRIMFVVRVTGKPDFETKSIAEAVERYNSF